MSRLNRFVAGIHVLDLTRHLPGPLATLLLGDMGAEILKIEGPAGDEIKSLGPQDDAGRSLYYEAISAGKRTLGLDLKEPADRERFLVLVDTADVLIESFRPDVMPRLGLSSDTLRARNPRLIYVSLSGYGRDGPLAAAAGHDANYLAYAGALAGNGTVRESSLFYPPIADCLGSMFGLATILGALYARERDGRGCDIDIALADVIMPLQVFSLAELGATGKQPTRGADLLNGGWACYRIYATRDGREMALGAVEPKFWRAFCERANRSDWISRQGDDPLPQHELIREVATFFAAMTLAECVEQFATADCCLAPLLDLREAVAHPHHVARGLVTRAEQLAIFEAAFPAIVDGERPRRRPPREPWRET